MGADGGYWYTQKDRLRKKRGLSEEDIALWWRFVCHATSHDVREELLDVDAWERVNMRGEYEADGLRLPEGTDFEGKGGDSWDDKYYSNPLEEVWYYRTWIEENAGRFGTYYWWSDPRSWYISGHQKTKDDQGWYLPLVTIPTPDEISQLVRITEWFDEHRPAEFLETWT